MARIYKYQKRTDAHTTHCLVEPDYKEGEERITELCTIEGDTYVSVPDGITLLPQPEQIKVEAVTLTEELAVFITASSPHTQLIKSRVVDRIREKYSADDEIKMLRLGRCVETEAYYAFVDACRAWGKVEKEKLLGSPMPSEVAATTAQTTKTQAIADNLPSWKAVSDAIDAATTLVAMKVIVKKMALVLYWLATGKVS